ncbi:MAG: serine/threonine protein kinase [Cytophagaceae bacterium]|nr:serine/threonine protein kinase [Cytophagaceae bacterium]
MATPHNFLHRTIAGYRLVEYVGAGGMGEVFRAIHPETSQLAAVKVLYRPEFEARFRNEAEVQASVSHPNLTALYASDFLDDRPALVMEWVEGQSLDALMRRGRLENREVERVVSQIATAVAYLHGQGIVHRDLKPSNVRVRPDGLVKVLDFGIAKGQHTPRLTQEGYAVGTSEYMAPEQFRNRVQAKSDVWALGVLLYEMTTGYLPFEERNPFLLRGQIERGHYTDPRLFNPGLSPRLSRAIAGCLQILPAKRPSAAELVQIMTGPGKDNYFQRAKNQIVESSNFRKYGLMGLALVVGIGILLTILPGKKVAELPGLSPKIQHETIRIEVVNADDVRLIMPDGSVQTTEPFVVERQPGQPVPIIIQRQGAEQHFVIDPSVSELYQCYFDR